MDGRGRLIDFDLAREVNYLGAGRTTRVVCISFRRIGCGLLTIPWTNDIGHLAVYIHRVAL